MAGRRGTVTVHFCWYGRRDADIDGVQVVPARSVREVRRVAESDNTGGDAVLPGVLEAVGVV